MSHLSPLSDGSTEVEALRVLHVDDQPEYAEMTREFLERENSQVAVVVESGARAGLDRLDAEPFDCVISDYDMPEMHGLDFLRALRADYPDLPFLLYTGKGSEEIASEAISAGVTDYIQKGSGADHYTVLANRIENAVANYRSRHAAETAERHLGLIADRTEDILFMFAGAWRELLFVNSAYEDVWDGSIDELRDDPLSFLEPVHPEDRDTVSTAADRILDGKDQTIEFRVHADGDEPTWVRSETAPILAEDGSVERITGFVRDVTDRKRREQELETQMAAIEAAADGIAILDEDEKYVFMNHAHASMYGFDSPDALIGESWRACYDADEYDRFEDDILPTLFETGRWQGELSVKIASGERIHQWVSLTGIDDGRFICVVRDGAGERGD